MKNPANRAAVHAKADEIWKAIAAHDEAATHRLMEELRVLTGPKPKSLTFGERAVREHMERNGLALS